ncbi:hypothetical protein CEXT_695681 [Caerostris extrusa]|uniref:Uncharacterized protein n=1 Tax=Caerostris extrusa TaxID=172846 RepID=A0AAV4YC16_CAEEX|nr:hypothetical protein CEXT_695681 [Caerostris extrusa]
MYRISKNALRCLDIYMIVTETLHVAHNFRKTSDHCKAENLTEFAMDEPAGADVSQHFWGWNDISLFPGRVPPWNSLSHRGCPCKFESFSS